MEKEKLQRFSIRKLSVGAASVLIGLSYAGLSHSTQVKADTVTESQQTVQTSVDNSKTSSDVLTDQSNTDNSDVASTAQNQNNGAAESSAAQKSVRNSGGYEPLTANSKTENETPENDSKATTALSVSETEEKNVENDKNKVETTTLNLNSKDNAQISLASLAESKIASANDSDLATATDPSKLSKDDFAEGTRWTAAGWTRTDPNTKVAKESSFTYDDPSRQNIDFSYNFRAVQNGMTINATVDKNDIVAGNKILLATVNATMGNHQQNQYLAFEDSGYVNRTENKVSFDNQEIGYISGESTNDTEADYYLNVTNTINFASDPKINFKLNVTTSHLSVKSVFTDQIGNAGVDYEHASQNVGNTYYLVTNSQIVPITLSVSAVSGNFLPANSNNAEWLYDDANTSSHYNIGGVVYGAVSDSQNLQGVQKISAAIGKFDPDSPIFFQARTRYYSVYDNQMYWTVGNPANYVWNFNPFVVQKINTVKLANNLSSADVLAQTQPNTVTASYQNDGSYILGYNITPEALATNGKTYVENVIPNDTVINNQLKDQKQEAIDQTISYYQQRNWVPTKVDLLIYANTKEAKTENDVVTVTDLTPNSTVPANTDNYIVNGSAFDAELYKNAGVEYVDDDTSGTIVSKDSIIGKRNEDTNYSVNIPIGYVLAATNADGKNYKWDTTRQNVIYTFSADQNENDKNPIVIHLSHGRKQVVDSNVISETVHYQYEDGSKAADDYNAKHVVSSRVGHKDLVTGETIWDSDWSTEIFPEVVSPHINGYTADQDKIDAQSVDGTSQDIVKTVLYKANDQKIYVHYIDDDSAENNELHVEPLVGKSNTTADYTTATTIKSYLDQGYDLVSDDTQGQALRYDVDDENDQHYTVHLKHHISDVTRSKEVTETIHYVYEDGSKAHDDYVATKKFENHGAKDMVTGEITWDDKWTPANEKFDQVNSPEIPGYSPDKVHISEQNVDVNSKNLEYTVTYTQNPAPTEPQSVDPTPAVPTQPENPDKPADSNDHTKPKDSGKKVKKGKGTKTTTVTQVTRNNKPSKVIVIDAKQKKVTVPVKSEDNAISQLPKTGEDKNQVLAALGLASISLSSLLGLGIRKKKTGK